jgi:putative transposase
LKEIILKLIYKVNQSWFELTFGWLGRCRRLSKDYELLPEVSKAMIYAEMVKLMLKSLYCYYPC